MLRSTLPLAGGLPAATWTGLPAACASGSTLSDGNRTLNCRIADPAGPGDGSVTAQLLLSGASADGDVVTVNATIESDTSAPTSSTADATFTASSAPFYDLRKNISSNTLPAPFPYNSPEGVAGFAIPTSTGVAVAKAGGWSPLEGPVTWTETMTAASIDVSGYRLLNWGNYGGGCATQSAASLPANPGYQNLGLPISNQTGPSAAATYTCTQPGGPGTPVTVSWANPAVLAAGLHANMWIMLWVPADAVPVGESTVTLTAGDFEPEDVNGVSNYFAAAEPTNNNVRASKLIINADNRAFDKYATSDSSAVTNSSPSSIGTLQRGAAYQSVLRFGNTGTVSQTPVQICDVFDTTVQKLTPFPDHASYPTNSYAVAVTRGPADDPILAPAYRPGAGYDNTTNFAVDPAAYIVEFAAGEFDGGPPTNAPQSGASMGAGATADGCADGGTATGWHSSPDDPAIVAYANSLGLSDPLDVVNRVRVTFIGGPVLPGSFVAVRVRFTVRSTYRDATTQAGQTILATTKIGDVGAFNYPQSTFDPWKSTGLGGPVIAGRIGVDTAVGLGVTPTVVQAGAPGFNRATYTIVPHIAFGEDVSNTQPLRVVDHIPPGMRYVVGSASRPPDHVLVQPDKSTLIVWDLGDVTGVTNGNTTLPSITFVAEADPLAPTPSVNHNRVIAESVAPDGTAIDTDLPVVSCGTMVPYDVPPTPNVPVATIVDMPPPGNYSGCASQGRYRRMAWQQITIGNAFLELGAAKTSLSTVIEAGSADGVADTEVGWDLTITNTTSNTLDGVDIVDVLPFDGDGRDPESSFSGSLSLTSLTTDDTLSATPNALPTSATGPFPTREGTTFYVTDAAPASIAEDPYDDTNLAGGATTWCLLDDVGEPDCPATLADVTAVRIISGSLASLASRSVRIGVATSGNADDDLYTNTAAARAIGLTSLAPVAGDSVTVVASQIAGVVWNDADGDGVVGGSEAGIAGVDVQITGTGSDGNPVDITVSTDGDGAYVFPDLRSGSYTITVDQATARAVNAAYAVTFDPEHGITDPTGSFAVELGVNTTVNARNVGFATQSLSGVVYDDLDNDGVRDAGEEGNGGVEVAITGTDDLGDPVNTTTQTDSDGTFTFTDLRPGTYNLSKFQLPATAAGKNAAGTAGGTVGAPGSNQITDITLGTAENAVGYLFGELPPEIISGVVFHDEDGDGEQDPGEDGIPNVTVNLTGVDILAVDVDITTETLADGTFTFAGLREGTYTLTETQPSAYRQGITSTGGSVGAVAGDVISAIVVDGVNPTTGYLFGEFTSASIVGVVFDDLDADGVLDDGEPGIEGVSVELSGSDIDAPITPVVTTTGPDGTFTFDGLRPGTYVLTETDPGGYLDGREIAGTAGGSVSNAAAGSNTISAIALDAGEEATGYAFGNVRAASIAGVVFVDIDNDGTQGSEPGVAGVQIEVSGTDDFGQPVVVSAPTNDDGTYLVEGLRPGTYIVTETQPDDYIDGIDSAGSAGGTVGADEITAIVLGSGEAATGYLFGERAPVSISGAVFSDLDGDAARDGGESGIGGISIDLLDGDGVVIDTTTTAGDGSWEFTDLLAGTYGVRAAQPSGYADGGAVVGSAGGIVGVDEITGIDLFGDATDYLFAEIALSAIRGAVWHDADDDGVIDDGEELLDGVEITLGGDATATATTGADGRFLFADLLPGTYTLTETQPDDLVDGLMVVGDAGGDASAPNTITGIVLGADAFATGYGFAERTAALRVVVRTQTQDAPSATGPRVLVGDDVLWTYEVFNDGDTTLTDLELVDDELGAITCPATDVAPQTSITCEATGTATAGQYANEATVTAAVVPSTGTPSTPTELEATGTSHHFGMAASVQVTARVNGIAASTSPGPELEHDATVNVVITLENTGNVPLTLQSFDAGGLGTLVCEPAGAVAPGATVECTATMAPADGAHHHPVAFTLTGPDGVSVTGSTSPAEVDAATDVYFRVKSAPDDVDSDDDGLLDEEEKNKYGTDPTVPNAKSYGLTKYVPLAPARVLDTRNGIAWSGGMPDAGAAITLPVLGRGGVPNDPEIKAVVLNVTATDASGWGYVAAYPSGVGQPLVSNVNVDQAGETIANLVTVPVGPDGNVVLYTSSATHLVADVAGYYRASSASTDGRLRAVTPARVLDTREAQIGYSGGRPNAGDTVTLQVAGQGGVPATGASAVVLTVTIADSAGWGYVTAYPGGSDRPVVSNVNVHRAGQTVANQVIVPLGPDGTVQLYTSVGLHLVADVTGWFTDADAEESFSGLFVPVEPVRKLDTRLVGQKPAADGTITVFTLPGTIPGVAAAAAAVNVTATETDGPGYITAFPDGVDMPYTSVLNLEGVQETIADHVIAPVSAGNLAIYSYAGAHLVADVVGWYRE